MSSFNPEGLPPQSGTEVRAEPTEHIANNAAMVLAKFEYMSLSSSESAYKSWVGKVTSVGYQGVML